MSEEPQLPQLPDIGEILERKDKFVEKITSVIKCKACGAKYERSFKVGDFTFKSITDEECERCKAKGKLFIIEIFSEWIDPKKMPNQKR
jgi:hypothetical protein